MKNIFKKKKEIIVGKYFIVDGSLDNVQRYVTRMLIEGWLISGGISVCSVKSKSLGQYDYIYAQAMIKENKQCIK